MPTHVFVGKVPQNEIGRTFDQVFFSLISTITYETNFLNDSIEEAV